VGIFFAWTDLAALGIPFKEKNMAGAPEGNSNSSKSNRLWAETIRRAVVQSDPERLRRIAERMLDMAETGDLGAIKELGDRLDGKPGQVVTVAGDAANPLSLITRRIVDPADGA
jgi:hypothetical protein